MSSELTVKKGDLARTLTNAQPAEVLKPLITEIHLFDTFIAGTSFLEDRAPLEDLKEGAQVTLRREDDNKFDENAILVLDPAGRKLGYVPEKDNLIFSRLMDAGKRLVGKIQTIEKKGNFTQVAMGIYLVDF